MPSWLEALTPPLWIVEKNFRGVPSATLYSHTRLFACFIVLHQACHTNYFPEYDGQSSGAWYSTLGHNLTTMVEGGKVCRITSPNPHFPLVDDLNIRSGAFLSNAAFDKYLAKEEEAYGLKPSQRWNGSKEFRERAVVAHYDPFPGHIVSDWANLADFQYSIWESLGKPPEGEEPIFGPELTYYWPALPPKRFKHLASRVLWSIFGGNMELMHGKGRKNYVHACFKEIIFPMRNNEFEVPNESMDHFKERLYTALVKPGQPLVEPMYQVTWLWRSSRRYMSNAAELFHYLHETFRDFPVKGYSMPIKIVEVNDNMPYEEVLQMMRHTAFAIGLHGAAMFQTTFMPVGSRLLELVPYKCSEIHFQRVGRSLGVVHEVWNDTHFETTTYDNNCFTNSSWHALTDNECVRAVPCFVCTKDHPISRVSIAEVRPIVEGMLPALKEWLYARQPAMFADALGTSRDS